jgi:hypothetical protein
MIFTPSQCHSLILAEGEGNKLCFPRHPFSNCDRSSNMAYVVVSIYAVAVLFCVGATAWIMRAWAWRRHWHESQSDLLYVAAGSALLVGAGIGILIASQIVMELGYFRYLVPTIR